MSEALLRLEQVGMRFSGLQAVDALDFSVQAGQVFGLIGPNGAGKTTVFNLITGVYRPTSGKVWWQGQDITGAAPHRVAAMGIFRTFQTIRLFAGLTVLLVAASVVSLVLVSVAGFVAVNNRISQSVPHLHVHIIPRHQGDDFRALYWPRHRYAEGEEEQVRQAIVAALPPPHDQ